jgi:hypothetical protein
MDETQTTLGSGFVAGGWWVGSAWLGLGIIDRRAGSNIDLQVYPTTRLTMSIRFGS